MKKNESESLFTTLAMSGVYLCLFYLLFVVAGCEVRIVTPGDKLEMRLKNLENKIDVFDHRLDVQWVELQELKERRSK